MNLIRCIVVPQPVVPADRTKNYRLGWGRHLVWVFAIVASVCLLGSSAEADELSELLEIEEVKARCISSCQIKGREDYLACGRTTEACLNRLIYFPWWMSKALGTQCQDAQNHCEFLKSLDWKRCGDSCSSDAAAKRKEVFGRFRRSEFLKNGA